MFKLVISLLFLCHYTLAVKDVKVTAFKYSNDIKKEIIDFSKMQCECTDDYKVLCDGEIKILQPIDDNTIITSNLYQCTAPNDCHKIITKTPPIGACELLKKYGRIIKAHLKGVDLPCSCPIQPMTIKINKENLHGRTFLSKAKLPAGQYKFGYIVSNINDNTESYADVYYTVEK